MQQGRNFRVQVFVFLKGLADNPVLGTSANCCVNAPQGTSLLRKKRLLIVFHPFIVLCRSLGIELGKCGLMKYPER